MNLEPITQGLTTVLVLAGVFLLAYSAIRKQGISDTWEEIKEIASGGSEKAGEVLVYR